MAEDQERERLGTTFDLAAELYQDARPDYPEVLFDRLLRLTEMRPGDRVLEVGAGPGKATLPLLRRGLRVTAIEPGAALAGRARANVAGHPAQVVQVRFEDWPGPWRRPRARGVTVGRAAEGRPPRARAASSPAARRRPDVRA
jgi:protein-L-isoaspartate O-methyltransferase